MKKGNTLAGAVLLIFGVAIYFGSTSFPDMPEGHPGPGLFPSGIGILLALSALSLLLTNRSEDEPASSSNSKRHPMRLFLLLLVVAAFPILYLGGYFFVALFVTISLVAILFQIKWWRGMLISGLTCTVIYLLFNQLLQVQL